MRGIAEWHVLIPNEAFLVAKSALGPHGAKPPHIHMTQENQPIFHVNRPGLRVQSVVSGPRSVERGGPRYAIKVATSKHCIDQYYS